MKQVILLLIKMMVTGCFSGNEDEHNGIIE
jgi:hypothetical protein